MQAEYTSQTNIDSPYVVKCRNFILREKDVIIVMDYADGGTLRKFVSDNPDFFTAHPNEFKRAAFQLLLGLQAAHELNLIHRDIKPENILLKKEGNSAFPYRLMLADFG